MKKISKLTKTGICIFMIGAFFGIIQVIFYGSRLDENGVVRDSIFLPLSAILVVIGVFLLLIEILILIIKHLYSIYKSK